MKTIKRFFHGTIVLAFAMVPLASALPPEMDEALPDYCFPFLWILEVWPW